MKSNFYINKGEPLGVGKENGLNNNYCMGINNFIVGYCSDFSN